MLQGAAVRAEEVARAVDEAATRQARERSSPLTEFFEWLFEHLGFEAVTRTWEVALWILLAILSLFLAFGLARIVRDARRFARPRGDGLPAEEPVAARVLDLRREAQRARAAGDYRLALQHQLFALILGLGGRGDFEYRDGWTNRELLSRGRPSKEANAVLAPLVEELEPKEFGDDPVHARDVDRLEELCARYFGHLGQLDGASP